MTKPFRQSTLLFAPCGSPLDTLDTERIRAPPERLSAQFHMRRVSLVMSLRLRRSVDAEVLAENISSHAGTQPCKEWLLNLNFRAHERTQGHLFPNRGRGAVRTPSEELRPHQPMLNGNLLRLILAEETVSTASKTPESYHQTCLAYHKLMSCSRRVRMTSILQVGGVLVSKHRPSAKNNQVIANPHIISTFNQPRK